MQSTALDLSADIIDVRDIIARVEELETELESQENATCDADTMAERNALISILADLQGMGGDEQWRGDWYPVTLIRDSYFVEYVVELCDDIGAIPKDFPHWIEIDFERTARNVRMDYSSVDIDGVTYWTR